MSALSFLFLIVIFAGSLAAPAQSPKELHIAAAADLQPVLPTLAAQYEQATGVKIIPSFGSSATLAQQITNGDPQDLFLSADYMHAEQLVAANLTSSRIPVPYAHGVLVLWARKDSPAQPLTLDALTSPKVQKIAVANSQHAPYGFAAEKALASLHLTDQVASKLVVAENIGQTAQFAESGNAQVAIISLTIASSPHFRDLGTFVLFAPHSYPEIRQCAVVLKASKNPAEAQKFLDWLTSSNIQQSLTKFGLDPAN
ncbi:MAG TPA: molybdate ABC transporter substrate-binding protein [Acidobacteriaceae bacterium]|nr:molybdate ABC transporter substrate-binding protein [Acidobacteriaceae bacterium]